VPCLQFLKLRDVMEINKEYYANGTRVSLIRQKGGFYYAD